jgi:adenine-specific DNA-methyltransferase
MSDKYKKLSKEELLRLVEKQEEELKTKKYGLVWDSEREPEQVVLDCEENLPILERAEGKEVKTDESNDNILIEGDNYHALTVLNYTHKESIDVIYIDPPYNTGKSGEWKYNDKYVDENDGYRHSKWLNFMEKRLNLAKKLLTKEGLIFISIDDNEASQLKLLCDKIFGAGNFIAQLVWENKEGGGSSDSSFFRLKHEYILCYAKNSNLCKIKGEEKEEGASYNYKDEHYEQRGKYKLIKLNSFSIQYSESLDYEIKLPNGKIVTPSENGKRGCWRWSKEKYKWGLKNDFIEFKKNKDGKLWVYTKQYFKVDHNNQPIERSLPYRGVIPGFSSTLATKQLERIFGEKLFDYPKPFQLIKFLIRLYDRDQEHLTVLDFFAGSGTTAHAVLELNKEDNGGRKFILCTNNEVSADEEKKFKKEHDLSESEFKKWQKENKKEWLDFQEENGICSAVCYPRIKKVIEGYDYEGKEKELVWEKDFTLNTLRLGKADEIYQEYEEKRKEIKEKYDDYESSFKNNVIRLYGVKEVKGKKEGLGGNLQYFKTSFVKKTKNSDQLKLNLTQKCTQILCVKENIYNLEKEDKDYKIFSSNKKDKYLCVYYNFIDDSFDNFLKEMGKIKEEKKIYMFSTDNEVDKSLFENLENFSIEPIPQPILDIYRQLIRLNIKDK